MRPWELVACSSRQLWKGRTSAGIWSSGPTGDGFLGGRAGVSKRPQHRRPLTTSIPTSAHSTLVSHTSYTFTDPCPIFAFKHSSFSLCVKFLNHRNALGFPLRGRNDKCSWWRPLVLIPDIGQSYWPPGNPRACHPLSAVDGFFFFSPFLVKVPEGHRSWFPHLLSRKGAQQP